MSIIDRDALKRDGMPAFETALKFLEAFAESDARETAQDMQALYGQTRRLTERLDYLDARRQDDRKIREEIDARLRVVEEQMTNMTEALRGAQVELATLHRDVAELTPAPKCAVCHEKAATTGPNGKLCADCLADVTAGIEDAGLAGLRVRRPAELRARYRNSARIDPAIGSYCPACHSVVLHSGQSWNRPCEYCGAELRPVTSVRDDSRPPRITQEAVKAALNGNGHE